VTRAFYRYREMTLVLGARAGLPPGPDLPTVGQIIAQHLRLLVINVLDFALAESARLAPPAKPTTSSTITVVAAAATTRARAPSPLSPC